MTNVTLADEVALLAYDEDGSAHGMGAHLDVGLAGALLLELALARRIDVADGHVTVVDPAPTGDPLTDAALGRIAGDPKARRPKDWVNRLAKGARVAVLDRLVAAGVLARETGTTLWVFPRTRYPASSAVQPPAETDARQRMHAAVTGDGPVEPRTAALCALVSALGWERRIFPDLPHRQVTARLKQIRQAAWPAEAVRQAIEEVQAAVTAAVIAGSVTTTGS